MEHDIFNPIIDLHIEWANQIKTEWGNSSVSLKNYLKTYYNEDLNYCYKTEGININYILPYRKAVNGKFNGYYGKEAIERLEWALKAKALIMLEQETEKTMEGKFVYEALRLYLRVGSNFIKKGDEVVYHHRIITYKDFENMVNKAYGEALYNGDELRETLIAKCTEYRKGRYTPVKYHFRKKDFEYVLYEKCIKKAYDLWIDRYFPTLLDKYKEEQLNSYKQELLSKYNDWTSLTDSEQYEYNKAMQEFKSGLEQIKITKLSYMQFWKLIQKINNGELD